MMVHAEYENSIEALMLCTFSVRTLQIWCSPKFEGRMQQIAADLQMKRRDVMVQLIMMYKYARAD